MVGPYLGDENMIHVDFRLQDQTDFVQFSLDYDSKGKPYKIMIACSKRDVYDSYYNECLKIAEQVKDPYGFDFEFRNDEYDFMFISSDNRDLGLFVVIVSKL